MISDLFSSGISAIWYWFRHSLNSALWCFLCKLTIRHYTWVMVAELQSPKMPSLCDHVTTACRGRWSVTMRWRSMAMTVTWPWRPCLTGRRPLKNTKPVNRSRSDWWPRRTPWWRRASSTGSSSPKSITLRNRRRRGSPITKQRSTAALTIRARPLHTPCSRRIRSRHTTRRCHPCTATMPRTRAFNIREENVWNNMHAIVIHVI